MPPLFNNACFHIVYCSAIRQLRLAVSTVFFLCALNNLSLGQPTQSDATSKTYTEELRLQFEDATIRERATDQLLEIRSKTFGALSPDTPEGLREKYQAAFMDFRNSVGEIHQVFLRHQVAWTSEHDLQRLQQFGELVNASQERLNAWRVAIAEVHAASPAGAEQLSDLILEMIKRDTNQDMYEGLVPMARSFLDRTAEIPDPILEAIGYVGYANNDLDLAQAAWTRLSVIKSRSSGIAMALDTLSEQRAKWQQELSRRKADSDRDDNPRVRILTNKGQIIVELFEEEAPQAVANFIYLVEQGFYDKKTFFRVAERFAAQTGCERGDGTGDAGYTIRGEMSAPNHRNIFRGSLVLLAGIDEQTKQPNPDSGSSQFLFAMLPQPLYDGQMTVFGRVIEGLPVLGALKRLDLSQEKERKDKSKQPDVIVQAQVLRKRNHAYIPEIVSGRLR